MASHVHFRSSQCVDYSCSQIAYNININVCTNAATNQENSWYGGVSAITSPCVHYTIFLSFFPRATLC